MCLRLNCYLSFVMINIFLLLTTLPNRGAAPLPVLKDVEWQPLAAQVKRVVEAMDYLGSPFSAAEKKEIETALDATDTQTASEKVQTALDGHCLFGVQINPEMRVKVVEGAAKPE